MSFCHWYFTSSLLSSQNLLNISRGMQESGGNLQDYKISCTYGKRQFEGRRIRSTTYAKKINSLVEHEYSEPFYNKTYFIIELILTPWKVNFIRWNHLFSFLVFQFFQKYFDYTNSNKTVSNEFQIKVSLGKKPLGQDHFSKQIIPTLLVYLV